MKVLFFCRLFYPHIGGVEKHVFEISKILIRRGFTITVITELHDSSLKQKDKLGRIQIYRIPNLSENRFKKFKIWLWLLRHKKIITNADIIHCHDVFYWFLPFRLFYFKKRVFTTFHGYESYPIPKKFFLIRKLSEILSDGTICIGDFMRKWYRTQPNYVSYGGIAIPKKTESFKKRNSALFVGRLDLHTGVLHYVEAIKIIQRKYPDFEFLVIGNGQLKEKIKSKVKLVENEPHPEKFYQRYHFAFVSRYLSILEAMTAKRLVFALYDNPLKEDYLKMTPFASYIQVVSTSKQLIQKLEYFLKYPQKEQMIIENAYAWVKSQTWSLVVDTYLKLWQT